LGERKIIQPLIGRGYWIIWKRLNILLVEDDRTIAMGLEYSLQQEGYLVTLCHDVTTGKNALTGNKYDLCLFDLTLPDGSGYELCKLARDRWDIPIIILTACDEEVNVVMGIQTKKICFIPSNCPLCSSGYRFLNHAVRV